MSVENHTARGNIESLEQGVRLIRALDDARFTGRHDSSAAVGPQVRHCLDFYACFLRGLPDRRIDYTQREREQRLEIDRTYAAARIEQIMSRLAQLDPDTLASGLQVRLEPSASSAGQWCGSSVLRELQFLLSHTIHHYALIANLLRASGYELDTEFRTLGVSPSTLRHWNQAGTVTS